MIRILEGVIMEKSESNVVLDVSGFGMSINILEKENIAEIGVKETLYTKMIITENKVTFYGFKSKNKRNMFDELIRIKGIGPSICIKILNSVSSIESMTKENILQVKGVGNKLAESIIKELGIYETKNIDVNEFVKLGFERNKVISVINTVNVGSAKEDLHKLVLEKLCEV